MAAIDTPAFFSTQGAASPFPTALAPAPGDIANIRNFPIGQRAGVDAAIYSAGGAQQFRIKSPLLHDNVTGLTFIPAEVPAQFLIPRDTYIAVQPNDILTLQGAIAAAGTIVAALQVYYDQLPGAAARLHSWGDISGNVKYIKSIQVPLNAIAVGAWTDTPIAGPAPLEDQLHAGSDYAILGYQVNPAVDVIAFKGAETGNLRIGGPGPQSTIDITEYFIRMTEYNARPYIPVFNANNRYAFFASAFNHAAVAAQAATVAMIVAELLTPVTP